MLKFDNEIIFCFHTSPFYILTELVVQRQDFDKNTFMARNHYYVGIKGRFTVLNISTVNRFNQ